MKSFLPFFFVLFLSLVLTSCDENEVIDPQNADGLTGTGSLSFKNYAPIAENPINVFYHIPENLSTDAPILIVFHGAARDAEPSRNLLIDKANQLGFALIVPEFTEEQYPGGDGYNLGNIFIDGDNPSESTLNPKDEWAFSVIEPLFNYMKNQTGLQTEKFDIFGFSAGAQVAHKYIYFWPEASFNRVIASSSGWYTMPDINVDFPYGLKKSPAEANDLSSFFSVPLTVLIGTLDNDPNTPGLRRNDEADLQGTNRLDRAQYFFQESANIASFNNFPFSWQYKALNGVSHNYQTCAFAAVDILY